MIPSAFFQKFVVYGQGGIDTKKSVASFEREFVAWTKEQSDLKPAVLNELKIDKPMGEGTLVIYVLAKLELEPNKANKDRVKAAIDELDQAGRITYKGDAAKRGRGTGWCLAPEAPARSNRTAPEARGNNRPARQGRDATAD